MSTSASAFDNEEGRMNGDQTENLASKLEETHITDNQSNVEGQVSKDESTPSHLVAPQPAPDRRNSSASEDSASQLESVGKDASSIVLVHLQNVNTPITIDQIATVFSQFDNILRIVTFVNSQAQFHFLIEFATIEGAVAAKEAYHDMDMFEYAPGYCHMQIEYSALPRLVVKHQSNTQRDFTVPGNPYDSPYEHQPAPYVDNPYNPYHHVPPDNYYMPYEPSYHQNWYPPRSAPGPVPMGWDDGYHSPHIHGSPMRGSPMQGSPGVSPSLHGMPGMMYPPPLPGFQFGPPMQPPMHQGPRRMSAPMVGYPGNGFMPQPILNGRRKADSHHGRKWNTPVLFVSHLDENLVTPQVLFTLFSVVGTVLRVKILFHKTDAALIKMASPAEAQEAHSIMNGVPLFHRQMSISASKYTEISLPNPNTVTPDMNPEVHAKLTKDFTDSPHHRPPVRLPNPPCTTLHVANLPQSVDEKFIAQLFEDKSDVVPNVVENKKSEDLRDPPQVLAVQFFSHDRRMALVSMNGIAHAVNALVKYHLCTVHNQVIKVSFSHKKLPQPKPNEDEGSASRSRKHRH